MKKFPYFQSLCIICFLFCGTVSQTLDTSFAPILGTQGSPSQIVARPDGKFVVVGGFYVLGNSRRDFIGVFGSDGTIDPSFDIGEVTNNVPQANTFISRVVTQSDLKTLIVGSFTHINGVPVKSPVRLDVDGSVDTSFNVGLGFNSTIKAIKSLPGGKLLVCGLFTTFNGQAVPPLVRLNSDGSRDQTFVPALNFSQEIDNIALQPDGKIIAVGDVSSATGGQFQGIVRLNENGSLDSTFNPGTGFNNYPSLIELQSDGKMLVGGSFDSYNGTSRRGFTRINSNGTLDQTFNCNLNASSTLTAPSFVTIQQDGRMLIGGSFNNVNGTPRRKIARINDDGSLDQTFLPIVDTPDVSTSFVAGAVIFPNEGYLVFGSFFSMNAASRFNAALVNTDGTNNDSFILNIGTLGYVYAGASQPDGKLIVGDGFRQANGLPSFGIARFNADGSLDGTFQTGNGFFDTTSPSNGYNVNAIALQSDGKILVGGKFRTYNDIVRSGYVRLNPDGSLDQTFSNEGNSNGEIYDIVIQTDSKIVCASEVSPRLMRLNPNGTVDNAFGAALGVGVNNKIKKVLQQADGKLLIAGSFTSVSGVPRFRIARLNTDGSLDPSFSHSSGANSNINSMALQSDGKIVIGGAFTNYNGVSRNRMARLNTDGSLDPSFDPGSGADGTIESILIQSNGEIIIGGTFGTVGGSIRKKLAMVSSSGLLDPTFGVSLEWFAPDSFGASIYTMFRTSTGIAIGGNFTRVGNKKLSSFTRIKLTKISPFDFDGDFKSDLSIYRPTTAEWWYLRSSDGGSRAFNFGGIADSLTPADFTGDGKTDIAYFLPSNGSWFVLRSENFTYYAFPFGASGDVPVPGDYDADGKADAAVFRPSNVTWYISKSTGGTDIVTFGASGDKPVAADYDGDGKADIGVFRPNGANGAEWWIRRSSNGTVFATQFGNATDKAVPGDYTGDGKADIAFWTPSSGNWFVLRSEDYSYFGFPFGSSTDIPTPGDYDGDGKMDAAVFRPSNSTWYANRSSAGVLIQQFGTTGDVPVPNAFVR